MDLGNCLRSLGFSRFKAAFPMNAQSIGAMRLSTVMSGLFVLLSIPVLIFILAYNYRQNAAAINATLNDVGGQHQAGEHRERGKSDQSGRSDAVAARGGCRGGSLGF
jgi:hypothetical protein